MNASGCHCQSTAHGQQSESRSLASCTWLLLLLLLLEWRPICSVEASPEAAFGGQAHGTHSSHCWTCSSALPVVPYSWVLPSNNCEQEQHHIMSAGFRAQHRQPHATADGMIGSMQAWSPAYGCHSKTGMHATQYDALAGIVSCCCEQSSQCNVLQCNPHCCIPRAHCCALHAVHVRQSAHRVICSLRPGTCAPAGCAVPSCRFILKL